MPNTPNPTEIERENPMLADRLELLRPHADKLLMSALAQGHLRLAVQCERCGTWLVAPASVKRHLGPVCARHAQAEAGAA
jgi:hypothetical protein